MTSHKQYKVQTEGDLEVLVIHENFDLLSVTISPDLYKVLGNNPNQNILFHNDSCFDLFLIHINELFSEGIENVVIDGKNHNLSLFDGSKWLCSKHECESKISGFLESVETIETWLNRVTPFRFWCSGIDKEIIIKLSYKNLISFGGNFSKHSLLRLSSILSKLRRLCERYDFQINDSEILYVKESFEEELRNRLLYHASYIAEIVGKYFYSLHQLIYNRYKQNPTNDTRKMFHPEGVSSTTYKDIYGTVIAFFSAYSYQRFWDNIPITNNHFQTDYDVADFVMRLDDY